MQVYEASQAAGGRCKLLFDEERNDGFDGCNALLFGANREVMALAARLGTSHAFQTMDHGGESYNIRTGERESRSAFLLPPASPLVDLGQLVGAGIGREQALGRVFDYYHPLTETYIEPLSRSLMFASPEHVEARRFVRRLGYLMRRGGKGMRLMMPRSSLYHALVAPALDLIEREGGAIYFGQSLRGFEYKNGRISGLVLGKQKKTLREDDIVLLTVPAPALAALLPAASKPMPTEEREVLSVIYEVGGEDAPRMQPLTHGSVDWLKLQHGRAVATSYAPAHLMPQNNEVLMRRIWREIAPLLKLSPQDMPKARMAKERKAVCGLRALPTLPANALCAGEAFGAAHLPPLEAAIASGRSAAHKISVMMRA